MNSEDPFAIEEVEPAASRDSGGEDGVYCRISPPTSDDLIDTGSEE